MFAPAYTGTLKIGQKISVEGNCFETTTFELTKSADGKYAIKAEMSNPRSLTCSDFYLIGNTEVFHTEDFFMRGSHIVNIDVKGDDAIFDIETNGLDTYLFCEGVKDELLSIIQTVKAFVGGMGKHPDNKFIKPKVPEYMEKANVDFLNWAVNWKLEERPTQKVTIDESQVQTGDYFAVMRLDGLDPLIMYGTGSHSGHSVVAMRENGHLYIVESQDAWYWPTGRI